MALVRAGISGWVLHAKDLPGKPDFFFPTMNVAVFVDGCFWHGCPKCGHIPRTRAEFWAAKIQRNRERDLQMSALLRRQKIRVLRIWEHELGDTEAIRKSIRRLTAVLRIRLFHF